MNTVIAVFILISSCFVHAKPLEAQVSCNCSQWVLGHDGTMTLVKAHASLWQAAKLSEEFSKRLATERFE